MTSNDRVFIQEVGPRDGLQIEPVWVTTDEKIALINALSQTGVAKIEASSFVSPHAIPMLADATDVFAGIERNPAVCYVALVPNLKGAERAMAAEVDEINLVMSASETHNIANMRMMHAQSLAAFADVVSLLKGGWLPVNGTVATAFGCPFEGPQAEDKVLDIAGRYLDLGLNSITLADTTGIANPRQVASLVSAFFTKFPDVPLTLHFHDTRGMGLANAVAAYNAGARQFDCSVGGLGGCPYAPGAAGNVASEDLVHMFEMMGIATGVDLTRIIEIATGIPALVGHDPAGKLSKAGPSTRRYEVPETNGQRQGAPTLTACQSNMGR